MDSSALRSERPAFRGRRHDLVRKPDAGNPHVRFDERRRGNAAMTRTEAPAETAGNGYSPRLRQGAPPSDSTQVESFYSGFPLLFRCGSRSMDSGQRTGRMPGPCSDDLRTIAVEKVLAGESRRSVAKQLRMAASTVTGWFKRQSDTGSASASPMGGHRKPKLEGHRTWIKDRIEACPAITLAGLRDLLRERGVAASGASICCFLKSCGITRKKPARVADERNRPDAECRRKRWKRFQGKVDPRRLVFIDETWMKTSMSPRHGWSPKGRRAYGSAPFSHWNTSTFVAALRHDRIDACESACKSDPRKLVVIVNALCRSRQPWAAQTE